MSQVKDLEQHVSSDSKHILAQAVPLWGPIQTVIEGLNHRPILYNHIFKKTTERIGGVKGVITGSFAAALVAPYHAVMYGSVAAGGTYVYVKYSDKILDLYKMVQNIL